MRPQSSENSEFCNSGKSKVKGIFPWNHGFTVWRSDETNIHLRGTGQRCDMKIGDFAVHLRPARLLQSPVV